MHETLPDDQPTSKLRRLFGHTLARLRAEAGITRSALAQRAGLSRDRIFALENGLASPSLDLLEQLGLALGVDPVQFLLQDNLDELRSQGRNEGRFEDLFESTPISLWEEDLSDLFLYFDELRGQGIRDFRRYFAEHPEKLAECARRVKILNVNKATLEMLNAPSKEALFAGLGQVLGDDSDEVFLEEMAVLAEGGREFHGEITHRTLDGQPRHLVIHFQLLDNPLASGRVVVSLIDVTRQKATEQALRLSQARLDRAQEIARFGCFEQNLQTGETFWSDQTYRLMGHEPGSIVPTLQLVRTQIHPEDRPELVEKHEQAARAGESYEHVVRIKHPNGELCHLHFRASVEMDSKGRPLRIIGAIQDVSEQRRMEQMRRDVEHIMRHDLQTPLAAAATAARAFKDDDNLRPPQRFVLQEIERTTNRVLTMVRRHRDMFRMETGRYGLRPRSVDLTDVARTVRRELSTLLLEGRVDLHIRCNARPLREEDTLLLDADPFLLQTMLGNLVQNAVEASAPEEQVTLLLDTLPDGKRIQVHNHAPVPETVRETFFEKYATAGKSQGTGLGTYSARLIARTLGGDIHMETSEKRGTTLTVYLPVQAPTI
ncbi:PAS domain S-box-containing protein [Paucidesulfovibrio gracilis DSM 16080]|uniref:histidine kinase n=1 Tax=Paucidesulfovibrio gracilis DSM 16080 TaxID=1121449 RepID=A0A1T4XNL4_9BACT|nr:PAS domain-containing protein [Paucidesulfovibrio gracilis]SKA90665.1 PAS domain S-box-containing protein [Paucidesulfovibrio gracilis DSM 16080]